MPDPIDESVEPTSTTTSQTVGGVPTMVTVDTADRTVRDQHGDQWAADSIDGLLYQRVKIAVGDNDSAKDMGATAQLFVQDLQLRDLFRSLLVQQIKTNMSYIAGSLSLSTMARRRLDTTTVCTSRQEAYIVG